MAAHCSAPAEELDAGRLACFKLPACFKLLACFKLMKRLRDTLSR